MTASGGQALPGRPPPHLAHSLADLIRALARRASTIQSSRRASAASEPVCNGGMSAVPCRRSARIDRSSAITGTRFTAGPHTLHCRGTVYVGSPFARRGTFSRPTLRSLTTPRLRVAGLPPLDSGGPSFTAPGSASGLDHARPDPVLRQCIAWPACTRRQGLTGLAWSGRLSAPKAGGAASGKPIRGVTLETERGSMSDRLGAEHESAAGARS